jgi:glycosyltransferase involved in cell wall biosynthesis
MSGETSLRQPPEPTVAQQSVAQQPLTYLLVCDEWSPTKGGISQFNRRLATALAAAGHRTCCLVESATEREQLDARQRGVKLIVAQQSPAGPNLFIFAKDVAAEYPGVVVGHDVISGSAAWTWARHYLPHASLVHIVHTPSHIEPYKREDDATRRTEEREQVTRRIASDADVVAAVGPSLARSAAAMVGGGVSVLQLDPGMDVPEQIGDGPREAPVNPTVLVFSRGAHVQPKGLDIAAHAVAALTVPHGKPRPDLLIRGAPVERCDSLRRYLVDESRLSRGQIDVRPYTDDPEQLDRDLTRAMLCVMPSRAEGFGLAALEAIAVGTPVRVSDKSGLAETLRYHLGWLAEPMIVEVVDDLERDVASWRSAMQQVMDDPAGAFKYAADIRAKLKDVLRWDTMAARLTAALAIPAPRCHR